MLVKTVIRGNSIQFTATFRDANNDIVTPSVPTLTLHYKSNNAYINSTANMVSGASNTWSATWDSSNADVGIVQWHITGGSGVSIAEDGEFRIMGNDSNPGIP